MVKRLARAGLEKARRGKDVLVEDVNDLVSEFLCELLRKAVKQGGFRALAAEWCGWDDRRLIGTVRAMMFHLAVESHEQWDLVRNVRAAVKGALDKGLPPAPAERPECLVRGGRLHGPTVGLACAWLLEHDATGVDRWDVAAISAHLMAGHDLLVEVHRAREGQKAAPDPVVLPEATPLELSGAAMELADTFLARHGSRAALVLAWRDVGFQKLADALGVGLATAHAWFKEAAEAFRELAHSLGAGVEEVLAALAQLKTRLPLKARTPPRPATT